MVILSNSLGVIPDPIPFEDFIDHSSNCMQVGNLSPLSNPHSSAFVDLNGDCRSDLFFTSEDDKQKYFEVWVQTAKNPKHTYTYCLIQKQPLSKAVSQISFADFGKKQNL